MKILYIDESGDHSLVKIDRNYPVFVLAGTEFDAESGIDELESKTHRVKNELFGNTDIILHTSDIVGRENGFEALEDSEFRVKFYQSINRFICDLEFTAICCVIDKYRHKAKYGDQAYDPYSFSLEVLVERFCFDLNSANTTGYMIAESRGDHFDSQMMDAWHEIQKNGTGYLAPGRINGTVADLKFRPKSDNISGLQISDLVANPAGRIALRKRERNDMRIVRNKFRRSPTGVVDGWGLILLPREGGPETPSRYRRPV